MIANLQDSWTLFVQPLQAGTGWKLSDIQFAFTLFILCQTWVEPLDGWLIDRLVRPGSSARQGFSAVWAGPDWGTPPRCRCSTRCTARRASVRLSSTAVDRVGAEMVQGSPRAGVGHHRRRIWRRHGAVYSVHPRLIASGGYQTTFITTGLLQGLVIVAVAQFLRHPPAQAVAAGAPAAGGASQLGRKHFTTVEMLRTPQFYMMYVMFVLMATGGRLVTANAGPMAKSWTDFRGAHAGRDSQPRGQWHQQDFLGLGIRSPWPRDDDGRRVPVAGSLPVPGGCGGPALGCVVRRDARAGVFHLG